jgi:hypothetical protein
MLVKHGDDTLLASPVSAEAGADVTSSDYYAQWSQIHLTADHTGRPAPPGPPTEVTLDSADVGRLVACAIRHPNANMRSVVLATIWNHPEAFRQIFEFGLNASPAFHEIREIVAEALAKAAPAAEASPESVGKTLLPRMPLPAHLRDRTKR